MVLQSERRELADWSRTVSRANLAAIRSIRPDASHPPGQESVRFNRLVRSSDWSQLRLRSRAELVARGNSLARLAAISARLADAVGDLERVERVAAEVPTASSLNGWRSFAQHVRDTAAASDDPSIRTRVDNGALDAGLAAIESTPASSWVAGQAEQTDLTAQYVQWCVGNHVASASQALLALAVARMNLLYGKVLPEPDRSTPEVLRELGTDLDEDRERVWDALRADDPTAAKAAATHLYARASRRTLGVIVARIAQNAQTRHPHRLHHKVPGRQGRDLAEMAREHIAAFAVGRVVAFAAEFPRHGAWIDWVESASASTQPGSAFVWPHESKASTLADRPRAADGKERSVEGLVIDVDRHRRRRKLVSFATIDDGTATVRAAIPYINIDSGGMVAGCWVRVAGTWLAEAADLDGNPGLMIDRLNLTELGRIGWWDDARRRTNDVFTPVPHGLATQWSWQPGVVGAANQLSYETWRSWQGYGTAPTYGPVRIGAGR